MICTETQLYSENTNNAYAPMKGHGGIDVHCGYGSPIESPLDGVVYKVLDAKRPANDGTGFWAVFLLCEYKGQLGELCIGHPSKINVDVGQKVIKGQVIGLEGNRGMVYQNGVRITKAMQDAGDQRGSHRHWQFRPCIKVKSIDSNQFLTAFGGKIYRDEESMYYKVNDYENGYHGLSPDIRGILSDYTEWKMNQAIEDKVPTVAVSPVTPELQKLATILDTLKSVLTALRWKLIGK